MSDQDVSSTFEKSALTDLKLTSVPNAMANLLKAIIGSGILGLPYAFYTGGWLIGTVAFPLIALYGGYCILVLIRCKEFAELSRSAVMPDLGEKAFGKNGRKFVNVVLLIDIYGCCVTYCLFCSHNMELITTIKQEIWVGVVLGVFFFLSFIRRIRTIGFFSIIADICVFLGMILLFVSVCVAAKGKGKVHPFNWKKFPVFFGIVLFAFQSAELAIPIQNSMRQQHKFPLVMAIVFTTVCVLYLFFGLFVYLKLADNSLELITEAIDPVNFLYLRILVSVMFVISVLVNLLLFLFPLYELTEKILKIDKHRQFNHTNITSVRKRPQTELGGDGEGGEGSSGEEREGGGSGLLENGVERKSSSSVGDYEYEVEREGGFTGGFRDDERVNNSNGKVNSNKPSASTSSSSSSACSVISFSQSTTAITTSPAPSTSTSPFLPDLSPPVSVYDSAGTTMKTSGGEGGEDVEERRREKEEDEKRREDRREKEYLLQQKQSGLGNLKFRMLSMLGRVVVLLLVGVPSLTPIRHHFANIMGINGATTGFFISFTFPMILHLKIMWKVLPMWQRIVDIICIALSIPAGVYITYITVENLVEEIAPGKKS